MAAAPAAGARGAGAPAKEGEPVKVNLAEVRGELERLRAALARLDSLLDQVKELRVDLNRLGQVVDRLERVAEAPAELERQIRALSSEVAELGRRMAELGSEVSRRRMEPRGFGRPRGASRAGYDDGFYLSSARGRYLLRVNGILQTVFQVGQALGPSVLRPEEPVHLLGFQIPNAALELSGNLLTRRLTYFIGAELGGHGFTLHDFAFQLRTCPLFAITVGQFQVRHAQQEHETPYDLLFPDASVAARFFGLGRDIGLRLHFYQWRDRVFQELAVFNGGGANALSNDNVDLLYQVRAGVLPLGQVPHEEGDFRRGSRPPRLRVSGSYLFMPMPTGRDLDGKDGMDNSFVHQAAAEVSLWWQGLFLNGEFFFRHEDRGAAVTQLTPPERRRQNRYAAYGQASYTIRPIGLSVVGRYSFSQPVAFWRRNSDSLVHGWRSPVGISPSASLEANGVPEAVHEAGAGLIYHVLRCHLKFYLGYTYLYEQGYMVEGRATSPSRHVHLATLLAQARF